MLLQFENHQRTWASTSKRKFISLARRRRGSGWADMDYTFEHVGLKTGLWILSDVIPIINGEKKEISRALHFAENLEILVQLSSQLLQVKLRLWYLNQQLQSVLGDLLQTQGKPRHTVAGTISGERGIRENGQYKVKAWW